MSCYGKIAAQVLLERLSARPVQSSGRHVIDHLGAEERRDLFDALMQRAQGRVQIAVGESPFTLAAVPMATADLIPFLEGEGAEQPLANVGTQGFASALRDHFGTGQPTRPRILLTLVGQGNETQHSAREQGVDGGLLPFADLVQALLVSHQVGTQDPRWPVAQTYLEVLQRQPVAAATARRHQLECLDRYLSEVGAAPEKRGAALPLLELFLADDHPDCVAGPPLGMDPDASRLQENAALRAKTLDILNNPYVDHEEELQSTFSEATAAAILKHWQQDRDLHALRLGLFEGVEGLGGGREEKVAFLHQELQVRGAQGWHWFLKDKTRILLIAAAADVWVEPVFSAPLPQGQHLLQIRRDPKRGVLAAHPAAVKIAADRGRGQVRFHAKEEMSVYRIELNCGPRRLKKPSDSFWVVVYRTQGAEVAAETSGELSIEAQAWVRSGGAADFDTYDAQGNVALSQRYERQIDDPVEGNGAAEAEDLGAERGLNANVQVELPDTDLVVSLLWREEDQDSETVFGTFEEALYAPKSSPALVRALKGKTRYLGALTRLSPDGERWRVEVGSEHAVKVKTHPQTELAVATLLADPELRLLSQGEGQAIPFSEAFSLRFPDFLAARDKVFARLLTALGKILKRKDQRRSAPLHFINLYPLRNEISRYLEAWLQAVDALVEDASSSRLYEELHQLDVLVDQDRHGLVRELIVLPTHPWLLAALLRFQDHIQRDVSQARPLKNKTGLALSQDEVEELAPSFAIEDWHLHNPHQRLLVSHSSAFHFRFCAVEGGAGGMPEHIDRIVANKIRRYLEMHPHLCRASRTLRMVFFNAGDGTMAFEGIRLWLKPEAARRSKEPDALSTTPNVEVLLIEIGPRWANSQRFDVFFHRYLNQSAEKALDDLFLQKVRYRKVLRDPKKGPPWALDSQDYGHLCFVSGVVAASQQQEIDGAISQGWDGCFADGLLATYLRQIEPEQGDAITSVRGLWLSKGDEPLRHGIKALLMLNRRARFSDTRRGYGIYRKSLVPCLSRFPLLYAHADWVIHLDRELSLEAFISPDSGPEQPRIIEYSDQHLPFSPGYDP